MPAALDGFRILEIAQYVSGPYAGGLLGDLGAEVLKIEPPPHGDPYRGWTAGAYSASFCQLNRGKKSIVLDLRSSEGLDAALALARTADVLIENARPGAMDRLGLGYEALRELNPRLVYCSVTGFGQTGPYQKRPGYDTVGQAMSGLLSLVTDVDAPRPMGISLSDHIAGLYACYAVLAGIAARERTGQGQHVHTSLLQSSMAFLAENMARFLEEGGKAPNRSTRVRTAQVYAFTDCNGAPFVIHLSTPDKFWHGVARAIDRPDLIEDQRFLTRKDRVDHREDIEAILTPVFGTNTRNHWLARLQANDVPSATLNSLEDVVEDPQVQHVGIIQEVVHPRMGAVRMVGSGITMDGTPTTMGPAPMLGEHTQGILQELGFSVE
jgi:crotonobetainyl-CoA:carnitine CoA-transferase CaiB-like acyl-CoA transferase